MRYQENFPVIKNNPQLVYLDSGASSLKLGSVVDKMVEYYTEYGVNVHRGVYAISNKASDEYEETRSIVGKFLNANEEEIVFTKGATNGLNLVASSLKKILKPGDEVITSELEHHSSVMPWQQVCKEVNAKLVYVDLDENNNITIENFLKVLTPKTKVVALTMMSNVLGNVVPIKEIAKYAHEVGAIVIADGAQAVPHMKIDVKDLDIDFLAFSAHKMLGPTGLGILYGKYDKLSSLDPVEFGGDMNDGVEKFGSTFKDAPYKFEAGTPNIAEVIAFKEAIKYLEKYGMDNVSKHDTELAQYAIAELKKIESIEVYSNEYSKGIVSFNILGIHPHDAATFFDNEGVALRAGHHCAQLITKKLGVVGTLRASIYLYNTKEDIDKLIIAAKHAAEYFKEWII